MNSLMDGPGDEEIPAADPMAQIRALNAVLTVLEENRDRMASRVIDQVESDADRDFGRGLDDQVELTADKNFNGALGELQKIFETLDHERRELVDQLATEALAKNPLNL